MRRLICAVVRIWHKTHFLMARLTCNQGREHHVEQWLYRYTTLLNSISHSERFRVLSIILDPSKTAAPLPRIWLGSATLPWISKVHQRVECVGEIEIFHVLRSTISSWHFSWCCVIRLTSCLLFLYLSRFSLYCFVRWKARIDIVLPLD